MMPPSEAAAPQTRQPLWRVALSWLLPGLLLLAAFALGYRLGRRDEAPRQRDGIMLYDGPLPSHGSDLL